MKETLKLILYQRIDIALIVLYVVGFVIGLKADAPVITSGGLLFAIGNTMFNIGNKVRMIKSSLLNKK